ncbi:MAG: hypothetical protein JRJ21_03240 [Deltaproteobacteria bacterium]|nr:hypothetical protein [Deltaproteobacteria bacterium]
MGTAFRKVSILTEAVDTNSAPLVTGRVHPNASTYNSLRTNSAPAKIKKMINQEGILFSSCYFIKYLLDTVKEEIVGASPHQLTQKLTSLILV